MFWVAFSSDVLSFSQEFEIELKSLKTIISLYKFLIDSHMTAFVRELTTVCAVFLTLPVTAACAEGSLSNPQLIINDDQQLNKKDLKDYLF